MFAAIKQALPDAELHVLANDYNAWVVECDPNIDKLWVYPRVRHGGRLRWRALIPTWRMHRHLRQEGYNVAIAGGGVASPRALERVVAIGAHTTVGYVDDTARCKVFRGKLTASLPWVPGVHEVDLNMRLLRAAGIAIPSKVPLPSYTVGAQHLEQGLAWLKARGVHPGQFVMIGINARQAKRKPSLHQVRHWAAWAYSCHQLQTVFVYQAGAANDLQYPGDDDLVQAIEADRMPYLHAFRNVDGEFLVFGVMWQARTSIFPDGGLAHFAAASPGGVLTLFADVESSPPPDQWGPRGRNVARLEAATTVSALADNEVLQSLEALIQNGFPGA
jgi:heptosyltransferase III